MAFRLHDIMTRPASLIVLVLAIALGSCRTSKRIDIVPFLAPTESASLDELVEYLNEWSDVRSLVLRVDLQFETVERAGEGAGRQYRTAQGRLLLERPRSIRLNIEAPILSANIAEMASNGERFQLLIHPPEYRALIEGRNDESYRDETAELEKDPELEKAGPLVNIRPQHFTDAFLLSAIPAADPRAVAFLEEERVEEADPRPGARDDALVRKSYYVVTVARLGESSPRARYWFDRVGAIAMARQQVYAPDGRLVSDIRYSDYLPRQGAAGARIASRVHIDRPYDDYGLVVNVKPDGIIVNRELPETAFVVTAPEEWGDTVRRINLDERGGASP
jgi:hypothetical protein